MYAFALWDEGRRQGYLVRDPMGIKPLFVAEVGNQFVFGSEAKALLAFGVPPELDLASLHQLLNFRYVTGDASLFKGIRQLPPGAVLTWTLQAVKNHSVGQPSQHSSHGECGGARFDPQTMGEILERAVTRHLASDVPLGCFLSGGIDSALIARHATEHTALSSYTLAVGDDPAEADNAADTAAWLGIPNHRQVFELPDICALHRDLLRHLEAPKVNALQGMLLSEFTARHVKVALSGLGGDELFYGYNGHQIMWLAAGAKRLLPGSGNRLLARLLRPALTGGTWDERQRSLEMLDAMPDWARAYGLLRNVWDSPALRPRLYGEKLLDTDLPDSFEWLAGHYPAGDDPVAAMAEFERKNKLVNDLLWNEDRVSMRVGLESRVPFLDRELVEYVSALPRRTLMPWGRKKHALKRYARTVLPERILRRRKSGFQLDIVSAAHNELKPFFDQYLSEERLRTHRLFNPAFVAQVRAAPAIKAMRWHWFILYLMAQTHTLIEEFNVA